MSIVIYKYSVYQVITFFMVIFDYTIFGLFIGFLCKLCANEKPKKLTLRYEKSTNFTLSRYQKGVR